MSIGKLSIRLLKAAREVVAWSQEDLAEKSGVSLPTIQRLEAAGGALGGRPETREKIMAALEKAGVEFTNGDEPGVKLKPPKTKRNPK
jgi:transcriptional regulator with XRE-family HTH domain